MSDFKRIVSFLPAFDKRHVDPKQNYGIHGVELRMVLVGPLGAAQFLLYTNWQLPHVTAETIRRHAKGCDELGLKCSFVPLPADKGYHWSVPRYKDQIQMKCDLLPQGFCYYDGSSLNAEPLYEILLTEGDEGVWRNLEDFYNDLSKEES